MGSIGSVAQTIAPPVTNSTDVSQQQVSVIVNGVTFNVDIKGDGQGGASSKSFSGLAQLISSSNVTINPKLQQLSSVLHALGITEVFVDEKGKLIGIDISGRNINREGLKTLLSLIEDKDLRDFLIQVMAFLKDKPNVFGVFSNNILSGINSFQDSQRHQLLMSIFKIALEARSEVVKMIIEAMEENHIMWLEMLKLLAEKVAKTKAEAKALLEKLKSKIYNGEEDAAKGISALFVMLGVSVPVVSIKLHFPLPEKSDSSSKLDKGKVEKFAREEGLNLKESKDLHQAQKISDASVKSGFWDSLSRDRLAIETVNV